MSDNRQNNSDVARDLIGFMIVCGVIGGPALLVCWVMMKLFLGILF
ncbi:hypothetical protein SEA_BILLNYE_246 [Streptomyces phage BillNye]|uniref:Uncharacterized protein n=2 Tax=Wilnyevirus billnye TaxID=2560486 RepID=A0A2L1IW87_9CAUD|nr:hypothetical protein FDJ30_gp016 [Streptomyces phage BillNye]AVD99415.1 hypothetical protein SEA_BILLNYE_246 [Streptomyces phage BillNye]QBZ72498.1 hypothetical protein SEA_CIRCINUS_245 [Streptomyces phage Circinus]